MEGMNVLALKIALAVVVFFIVFALSFGYGVFAKVLARPKRKKEKVETEEIYIKRLEQREKDKNTLFSRQYEDVEIKTPDDIALRSYFFPSGGDTKRFVLFSHGYNCNGPDEFSHIVPFYLDDLKYNVLLPDHRAHGRSEGKYIGFSVLDSKDILLWVDYLTKHFGDDIEIIMHGASMGAATILLANESENIQPQVKLIVEDCGFSNAKEELICGMQDMFGFRCMPIVNAVNIFCRLFAKYDLNDSDPIGNINKSKKPILFIHGAADNFVPTRMAREMYDACTAVPCDILIVEGAIHVFSFHVAPEAYKAKISEFIHKNIGAETTAG